MCIWKDFLRTLIIPQATEIQTSAQQDLEYLFQHPLFRNHRVQLWPIPGDVFGNIFYNPGYNLKVIVQTQETRNLYTVGKVPPIPSLRLTKPDKSVQTDSVGAGRASERLADVKVTLRDAGSFNPNAKLEIDLDRIVLMEYSEYFRELLLAV